MLYGTCKIPYFSLPTNCSSTRGKDPFIIIAVIVMNSECIDLSCEPTTILSRFR